jgi:hypothetical protein
MMPEIGVTNIFFGGEEELKPEEAIEKLSKAVKQLTLEVHRLTAIVDELKKKLEEQQSHLVDFPVIPLSPWNPTVSPPYSPPSPWWWDSTGGGFDYPGSITWTSDGTFDFNIK